MCIICFLEKNNQYMLMQQAQAMTDRFEHTLEAYKRLFISGFMKEKNEELCAAHKKYANYLDVLNNIEEDNLNKEFNVFINAYVDWINNDTQKAVKVIEEYLKEKHLLDEIDIKNRLMFRARKYENVLSHWDMFHIPFNKRYLIGNQRYSLIGRPMLYLGFTPSVVLDEIRLGAEDNAYISGFYLNKREDLKICDLRYDFPQIDKREINKMLTINYDVWDNEKILKRFYVSIISLICGFKVRRENYSGFCEEYVLPQILSEIVENKGYDGLAYSSTHARGKNAYKSLDDDTDLLIFTKYSIEHKDDVTYVYDKDLYRKFKITTPKKVSWNFNITDSENELIFKAIIDLFRNDKFTKGERTNLEELLASSIIDITTNNNKNADIEKREQFDKMIKKSMIYEIIVKNYMVIGGK